MILTRAKNIFMLQNINYNYDNFEGHWESNNWKMSTKHSAQLCRDVSILCLQNVPLRGFLISEASRVLSDVNLLHGLISYCKLILVLVFNKEASFFGKINFSGLSNQIGLFNVKSGEKVRVRYLLGLGLTILLTFISKRYKKFLIFFL